MAHRYTVRTVSLLSIRPPKDLVVMVVVCPWQTVAVSLVVSSLWFVVCPVHTAVVRSLERNPSRVWRQPPLLSRLGPLRDLASSYTSLDGASGIPHRYLSFICIERMQPVVMAPKNLSTKHYGLNEIKERTAQPKRTPGRNRRKTRGKHDHIL